MRRLFSHDPETGIKEFFTHKDGKNIIETVQDVEPIVELNKSRIGNLDKKSNWWWVGRIPHVVCVAWARESDTVLYGPEWREYAKKKLNDPENRLFNTNKIRL